MVVVVDGLADTFNFTAARTDQPRRGKGGGDDAAAAPPSSSRQQASSSRATGEAPNPERAPRGAGKYSHIETGLLTIYACVCVCV
jgi:hypothetical protein